MRRGAASARPVPTFNPALAGRTTGEQAEDLADWPDVDGLRGSTRQQAGTSRAAHGLLWSLLVGGVVLGLTGLAAFLAPPPATSGAAGRPSAAATAAIAPPGGCAELVVTAWLAGDVAALRPLLGREVPRLPAGQRTAQRTYTVSVTVAPGPVPAWSYLVGADVLDIDKAGASKTAGVQFFALTLARHAAAAAGGCQGWTAVTLPAQVAGLADVGPVDLDYDRTLPVTGPLPETLTRFFTALLAGAGDLDRYTAPGVTLRAIRPAPYTAVRLDRLMASKTAQVGRGEQLPADGTHVQVLATVAAYAGDREGDWQLVYPLELAVRGGRWEVTALQLAPAIATPAPASSPTPTSTSASPPASASPPPSPTQQGSTP
jgi:hypothetical protein